MLVGGPLAELMVMADPQIYRKCVTYDCKRVALLYVKTNKALYGLMNSVMLFYKKLVEDIEANIFNFNPYDPCVANNMINGKQMTVAWYVDDLKVSHQYEFEMTKFTTYLSGI